MARRSLRWNGRAVTAQLRAAQIEGVNRTMAGCVVHAKRNHPWRNRSTVLEGGIDVVDYAAALGSGVRGVWGVRDVVYALMQELGGTIVPKTAKALAIPQEDGSVRFVQSVTIPASPYLRPAADALYPTLARRIRRAYERRGSGQVT